MLTLPPSVKIYLASAPVDMRRGHDGLMAIVKNEWALDPFTGHLFVFVGRQFDRIKVFFWDRGGFVLFYKRLEKGRFKVPWRRLKGRSIELESGELSMLLDGINISHVRRPSRWRPPQKKERGSTQGPISDPT